MKKIPFLIILLLCMSSVSAFRIIDNFDRATLTTDNNWTAIVGGSGGSVNITDNALLIRDSSTGSEMYSAHFNISKTGINITVSSGSSFNVSFKSKINISTKTSYIANGDTILDGIDTNPIGFIGHKTGGVWQNWAGVTMGSCTYSVNIWTNVTMEFLLTNTSVNYYVNNVFCGNRNNEADQPFYYMNIASPGSTASGVMLYIDDLMIYNESEALSSTTLNVSQTYPTSHLNFTNTNTINFNATANATNNFNCSLYINSTLNQTLLNISSGTDKLISFSSITFDNLKKDYNYYFFCTDQLTNVTTSTNIFHLDSYLNISSLNPLNNTQYLSGNNINVNASLNNSRISNCNLTINNIFNESRLLNPGLNLVNYTLNFNEGNNNISIACNDSFNGVSTNTNILYFDYSKPSITTNVNNSYQTDFYNLTFNISDNLNLYSLNVTDSCGYSYFNNTLTNPFNFSYLIDVINCSYGNYTTNILICDGFTSELNCLNNSYNWFSMAQINVTAISGLTSLAISNFSVYLNGSLLGNTTTGTYSINNLTLSSYNISIDSLYYSLDYAIINTTNKTFIQNFTLYSENSISMIIKDEDTGLPITNNVSIKFTSAEGEFTNTTNTSTFYIDDLSPIEYTITFSSYGYSNRIYAITVGNRTHQNLNAFLTSSTSTTIFNIMDQDSFESLVNVSCVMYRIINGSWQSIESKYSDITGRAQFTYVPLASYKFYLSKTGYNDNVFYLNPILFSSYDIKMVKDILLNYSQDYDGLNIIYAPSSFNNNALNTFNFIISSPVGSLVYYGYNLSYPGGSNITYGTNALGEQLSSQINITNATVVDFVRLDYYYFTTISGLRNFTVNMPINFVSGSGSNNTLLANKDKTYGLGAFERVLICTLIIIFVVGIASMVGKPVPGIVVGLFLFGYLSFIGFIELWAILPSMFIGFIFVVWKSGGY